MTRVLGGCDPPPNVGLPEGRVFRGSDHRVSTGFCFLAAVLDACSCKVVGNARSQRLDTHLVLAALRAAVANRALPLGCIHYTDRGAQYASQTYSDALQAAGLQGSMSSVGNPYHNSQAESFMKTLKVEEVYRAGYETFADVAVRLPRYIEQVYKAKKTTLLPRIPIPRGVRNPTHPEGGLDRMTPWSSPMGSLHTQLSSG